MQAAAWSVLAAALLDAAAEGHLRQESLPQPRMSQWLGADRAGKVQCGHRQVEHRDIRREPTGHVEERHGVDEVLRSVAGHEAS